MKRSFFLALYYGLARYLPASYLPLGNLFKSIRYQICRHLFASCGKNVNVESAAFFYSGKNVSVGDNSGLGRHARISGKVTIGRDVMMGPHVTIYTRNHDFSRTDIPMNQQDFCKEEPVTIGDDVWIGSHIIILPGVSIGRGSVIGAGSVVTKDVPEWTIVAGNPAKVIRSRKS